MPRSKIRAPNGLSVVSCPTGQVSLTVALPRAVTGCLGGSAKEKHETAGRPVARSSSTSIGIRWTIPNGSAVPWSEGQKKKKEKKRTLRGAHNDSQSQPGRWRAKRQHGTLRDQLEDAVTQQKSHQAKHALQQRDVIEPEPRAQCDHPRWRERRCLSFRPFRLALPRIHPPRRPKALPDQRTRQSGRENRSQTVALQSKQSRVFGTRIGDPVVLARHQTIPIP